MIPACTTLIYKKIDKSLVGVPGVYGIVRNSEVVYVGKSNNLHSRLSQHKSNGIYVDGDIILVWNDGKDIMFLERKIIDHYKPVGNTMGINTIKRDDLTSERLERFSIGEVSK